MKNLQIAENGIMVGVAEKIVLGFSNETVVNLVDAVAQSIEEKNFTIRVDEEYDQLEEVLANGVIQGVHNPIGVMVTFGEDLKLEVSLQYEYEYLNGLHFQEDEYLPLKGHYMSIIDCLPTDYDYYR